MSEIHQYQPGQVVNGHVWTGTQWLPIQESRPQAAPSPWRTIGGVVALVVAGIAGLMGVSWLMSWLELENQGNAFASILMLLGMGALAVAAGFGIAGIVLITKK
jgi:hypothetical protein